MEVVTQLTVIIPNRPGALADILDVVSENNVNVAALCVVDTTEHGLVRLVVDDPDRLRKVLEQCGIPFGTSQTLSLALPNTPGALANVARALAAAKINIDYAYGSTSQAEPARAILGVSDPAKAAAALDTHG